MTLIATQSTGHNCREGWSAWKERAREAELMWMNSCSATAIRVTRRGRANSSRNSRYPFNQRNVLHHPRKHSEIRRVQIGVSAVVSEQLRRVKYELLPLALNRCITGQSFKPIVNMLMVTGRDTFWTRWPNTNFFFLYTVSSRERSFQSSIVILIEQSGNNVMSALLLFVMMEQWSETSTQRYPELFSS